MAVIKFPLELVGLVFEILQDPQPAKVNLIIMKQKVVKEKYLICSLGNYNEDD